MRIERLLIGLVALLALGTAREAWACECATGPPCQNAFQVDTVFAGTVGSITVLPDDEPPPPPGSVRIPRAVRVDFTAVEGFLGMQAASVSVVTPGSGPACGYEFERGERYLVYATQAADGTGLVTGLCSRTKPLADAAEDLRFIQTLSGPSPGRARVYGTITHWERDLATGEGHEYGPVANVIITVRNLTTSFDASTDASGRYEVGVPPGNYEVTAMPPPAFSSRYLKRTVELRDARACFVADFGVRFDGRIRGVVRHPSGEPAEGVYVQAMAAAAFGRPGNIETLGMVSDAGGAFEFSEVPPGQYVVGIELTRGTNRGVVFPVTFHPGTGDYSMATIVDVDGGEQRELEPMTLPPPRRSYRLAGTVVFEDGTPASGVFISLVDGRAAWRQVAEAIKTESDGTFSFVVHDGLSYVARASSWDEAQRNPLSGTFGPFVVTGDIGPLRIVLSARR